ncbi:MAG: hypothetical protein ABI687_12575, partial [Flavitalea sp.]
QLKDQKKTDLSLADHSTAEQNQVKQKEKTAVEEPITNSGAGIGANAAPQPAVQQNNSGSNTEPIVVVTESAQPKSGSASISETIAPTVGNSGANTPVATEAEKKSLGVYKVVSKANFYTAPNETSLSAQFIYQFSPVTLDALEETKDFILVVTKSNLGAINKGWLSKKDLRRIDQ